MNLAVSYDTGDGVAHNAAEAARWYREAAQGGEPVAQYNLGLCLRDGDGVRVDAVEALNWFLVAAHAPRAHELEADASGQRRN